MLSVVRNVLCTGVKPYGIPPPLPRRARPLYTSISMLSVVRDVLYTGIEPYSSLRPSIHALCRPQRPLYRRKAISHPSAPTTARTPSLYLDIHALRRPRRPLYRRRAISLPPPLYPCSLSSATSSVPA